MTTWKRGGEYVSTGGGPRFTRGAALAITMTVAALFLEACAASAGQPSGRDSTSLPGPGATVLAPGDGQAVDDGGEVVTFSTEDGVSLSGRLYGSGDTVALLAHMRPADQRSWQPFARTLAEAGFAAFTFDFRGYGASGGSQQYNLIDRDVRAAIAYLRGRGFSRIALIGASMGSVACVKNAHEANVTGLVLISTPRDFEGIVVGEADLTGLDYDKLFVASEDDEPYVTDIRTMHSWASVPKNIKLFSGNAHGTDLLDTEHQAELEDLILTLMRAATGDT